MWPAGTCGGLGPGEGRGVRQHYLYGLAHSRPCLYVGRTRRDSCKAYVQWFIIIIICYDSQFVTIFRMNVYIYLLYLIQSFNFYLL